MRKYKERVKRRGTCIWANREHNAPLCDYWSPCELCAMVLLVSKGHCGSVSRLSEHCGSGTEHQQSAGKIQSQGDDLGLHQDLAAVLLVYSIGHRSKGKTYI